MRKLLLLLVGVLGLGVLVAVGCSGDDCIEIDLPRSDGTPVESYAVYLDVVCVGSDGAVHQQGRCRTYSAESGPLLSVWSLEDDAARSEEAYLRSMGSAPAFAHLARSEPWVCRARLIGCCGPLVPVVP